MSLSERVQEHAYKRRWLILLVLCFSLLVIVLDNTILNVAIPTLSRELDPTNSQLQWMVDSYTLVFAGLLLTAGSLGDRFGRRGALQVGLILFGIGSLASALATTSDQLIATRAFMGIGGAFIMPATLSIITNVFPSNERGKAIGVWAGTAGIGIALGPLTGGFLLEHFYWGSIFLVNIPIVAIGLLAGVFLIPTSKDPNASKLDPLGAVLSISGLTALLYGIIEAPSNGWTDPMILASFGLAVVLLGGFLVWERTTDHPMLDIRFFKNPRFSAASTGITMTFFALFGATFLLTQYMQFVLGYSPLEAGIRLLPFALVILVMSPLSAKIVERVGTKVTVASGLTIAGLGLVLMTGLQVDSSYGDLVWRMMLMAFGQALVMAPATESIMGSLPLARAGVGSAVNDTTRQIGGALGVAIVGSVMSSTYASKISDLFAGTPSAGTAAEQAAKDSLGGALAVAQKAPAALGKVLAETAKTAFVDGMHTGVLVAAAAAFLGAIVAAIWLPAHATDATVEEQAAEFSAEHARRRRRIGRGLMTQVADAPERRPGRPRSVEADEAILEAATAAFIELGWDGLTIEGVAARAGVGKTTIYRRYPTRLDLLLAAAERLAEEKGAAPDTGTLRGDLFALVEAYLGMLSGTRAGRAIPAMVAATAKNPELAVAYREFIAERRRESSVPLERAIGRGELPLEVDVDLALDLLLAPLFYRAFVSHEPADEAYVTTLVESVLRALQA